MRLHDDVPQQSKHESAFKGEQRLDGFKGADGKGIGGRPWWALSEKKQKSKRKRAELHQAKLKAENQEAQIFDRETRNRQQITIVDPNGVPLDAGHTVEGAIQKAITFKKLLQQAKRQYLFTFFPSKYSNFSWAI